MANKTDEHELVRFRECNLGTDNIVWNYGYDRAVCSCGWESAASKDQKTLVALFEVHLKTKGVL
jgi:hypothetical protein